MSDTALTTTPDALEILARTEIDVQIKTAKAYPRDMHRVASMALSMATIDADIAAGCTYRLPRREKSGDTKEIIGPSVRLAEIMATAWGNIRFGARIVEEGKTHLVAQGMCHDLERNVATSIEVRRPIVGRNGQRYSVDMISVTANAAASIAIRNAVMKVIPRAIIDKVWKAAQDVARGDQKTLPERATRAMAWFVERGANEAEILGYLMITHVDSITLDHLAELHGIATAVTEGELPIADAFTRTAAAPVAVEAGTTGPERVADLLTSKAGKQAKAS